MTHPHNHIAVEYSDSADISEADFHQLLSVKRRRLAIDILADRSEPISLEALARAVTKQEGVDATSQEEKVSATSEKAIEQAMITLHHHHLPKMDDIGVIEYDPDERRVASESFLAELSSS